MMFQITVVPVGANCPPVALFYKSKEAAEISYSNIHAAQKGNLPTEILMAKDDFGAVITIHIHNICYAVFIDGDKQQELRSIANPKNIPEA